MFQRCLIALLMLGSTLLLAAMLIPALPPILFAIASLAFPSLLIALGLHRRPFSLRRTLPAWILFLILESSGLLLLRSGGSSGSSFGGLPPGAWVMLLGFWLLPLVILSSWYAHDFERFLPAGLSRGPGGGSQVQSPDGARESKPRRPRPDSGPSQP